MEATETVVTPPSTATPEAPEVLSVRDHVQEFDDKGRETDEQRETRLEQKRERDGKFAEGKRPVRPSKQFEARVEKVAEKKVAPIQAEKSQLERTVAGLQAEVERLKRAHAPVDVIAKAEGKVDQADARPKADDEKYGGDFDAFLDDHARWAAREERRTERETETKARADRDSKESAEQIVKGFGERVESVKTKYPDFEKVAFGPTRIPAQSTVDQFVMEDDNGPEVLYYLNSHDHAQELDEILRMPVVKQMRRLSAIAERFSSFASESAAASSGAVTERKVVKLPPKPPTPLRTEAQRATDGPPPMDGSLGVMGHRKAFGSR